MGTPDKRGYFGTPIGTILSGSVSRWVYFGFHYQRDIWRVQQVKKHPVTKGGYKATGYFDGSLEEKSKTDGDEAVKRLINKGMEGSTLLCVLVGAETYTRRWVRYEIFKAIERGMGMIGIRIHQLKDSDGKIDLPGSNPFHYLGYGTRPHSTKLYPHVLSFGGWHEVDFASPIERTAAAYLPREGTFGLESLVPVYDWVDQDGYNNFGDWCARSNQQRSPTVWI